MIDDLVYIVQLLHSTVSSTIIKNRKVKFIAFRNIERLVTKYNNLSHKPTL